jgi:hypothetical protein
VSFDFSGDYQMFRKTSIDVVGPNDTSALLPGAGNPDEVGSVKTFPFMLSGSMFWNEAIAVRVRLADGRVETRCLIDDAALTPPCTVALRGAEPEVGEEAAIRLRTASRYFTLLGQSAAVVNRAGRSVMVGDEPMSYVDGAEGRFTITEDMFRSGQFEVRTAIGGGRGWVVCKIRP